MRTSIPLSSGRQRGRLVKTRPAAWMPSGREDASVRHHTVLDLSYPDQKTRRTVTSWFAMSAKAVNRL